MSPAQTLLIASAGALLLVGRRQHVGAVEVGDAATVWDAQAPVEDFQAFWYAMTDTLEPADNTQAADNLAAFLAVIRYAEGTQRQPDPYRVTYGYGHTIADMSDHPALTGEWLGVRLSDDMCSNAGFGAGCMSTAAGAYQIIRPTWMRLRRSLGLVDFSPASQDTAAAELVRQRGALGAAQRGEFERAVHLCRQEWASLPGNSAKQGQRSIETLAAWYGQAGGSFA